MKNSYKIQCFLYGSPSAVLLKKKGFESKGNIHIFKSISTSQFWAVSCISNIHIGHICSALQVRIQEFISLTQTPSVPPVMR